MPSPSTSPSTNPRSRRSPADPLRELTPADLSRLQVLQGYPMVSVLVPTTPSAGIGPEASTELSRLIDRAEQRLASELPDEEVDEIIDALRGSPTGSPGHPPSSASPSSAGLVSSRRTAFPSSPRHGP